MSKQPVTLVTSPLDAAGGTACCEPLAVRALTPEQAVLVAPMFKALGDPIRLRLMSMIASRPEACVCDLTGAFDVSGPTISHHLRVLREAGLVDCERRGTWVYYWCRPEAVRQLGALLDPGPRPVAGTPAPGERGAAGSTGGRCSCAEGPDAESAG